MKKGSKKALNLEISWGVDRNNLGEKVADMAFPSE